MASSSLGDRIVKKLEKKGTVIVREKFTFSFTVVRTLFDATCAWISPLFFDEQTQKEWYLNLTRINPSGDVAAFLCLSSSLEQSFHAYSQLNLKFETGRAEFNTRTCRWFHPGLYSSYEQHIPSRRLPVKWEIFITIFSDVPDYKVKECLNECLSARDVIKDAGLALFMSDMGSLLEEDKFSDVVVKVADLQIPAHKCILSARSLTFRVMFAQESSETCVMIHDLTSDTVRALLKFIYTGKVDISTTEAGLELLAAAYKYQVNDLKTACRNYLTTQLNTSNCEEIFLVAEKYSDSDLKQRIRSSFPKADPRTRALLAELRRRTQNVKIDQRFGLS